MRRFTICEDMVSEPVLPPSQRRPAPEPRPATGKARPVISVVVPIYNEHDNVEALHSALTHALVAMGRAYEIVLVDDGSRDGTRDVLRALAANDPHLRLLPQRQ